MQRLSLSQEEIRSFQSSVYDYFKEHKRSFVWRDIDDPYSIVVSEIMLQQTQTDRVAKKYQLFLDIFPTLESLAQAPLDLVISAWQGLGYNRRAIALKQFAQRVVADYQGVVPQDPQVLMTFKGIGPNTAGSICAFAFQVPTVFIETNIRSVFIHCFFKDNKEVHDRDLLPLIEQTVDRKNPRSWYYALMDYGVMLKKTHPNPSRKSKHHARQSRFEGSDRQVRGAILKMLVRESALPEEYFFTEIARSQEKIKEILHDLETEGFIRYGKGFYTLSP
jgi:A/G-specific adenine glycosylase